MMQFAQEMNYTQESKPVENTKIIKLYSQKRLIMSVKSVPLIEN
jgi:hypothetical protein